LGKGLGNPFPIPLFGVKMRILFYFNFEKNPHFRNIETISKGQTQ
jgi:hypothetical protein